MSDMATRLSLSTPSAASMLPAAVSTPSTSAQVQTTHIEGTPTAKVKNTSTEAFEAIKTRAADDQAHVKTLKSHIIKFFTGTSKPRLFENAKVNKEKISIKNKKENRSLNVRSKLGIMQRTLVQKRFKKEEISKILVEYKIKLKESKLSPEQIQQGETQVTNAETFFEYLAGKQKTPGTEDPLLTALLQEKDAFVEMDQLFVMRQSGAEKAVYLKDGYAVATPKTDKDQKVLEKEYNMTVDMRVNAMRKSLQSAAQAHEKEGTPQVNQIVESYEKALRDQDQPDIVDARSFFEAYAKDNNSALEGLFGSSQGAMKAAVEIDDSISGIDLARKKFIGENGRVYYKSAAAVDDLKGFLKSDKMNQLSPEQFNELMGSYDHLQQSMQQANLLHGDIKPDNIFVYAEKRGNKTHYSVKISDFGKSKIGFEKQLHWGNPRWHKGMHDTVETQKQSLSMVKLVMINAGTQVSQEATTPEEAVAAHNKLMSAAPKVSDVAYKAMDLGSHLYAAGDTDVGKGVTQYNYFSDVSKSVFSTLVRSMFRDKLNPDKNVSMQENTANQVHEFLVGKAANFEDERVRRKLDGLKPEERVKSLERDQLFYTKQKMSFELLENMTPVELNTELEWCEQGLERTNKEMLLAKAAIIAQAAPPNYV